MDAMAMMMGGQGNAFSRTTVRLMMTIWNMDKKDTDKLEIPLEPSSEQLRQAFAKEKFPDKESPQYQQALDRLPKVI